VKILKNKFFIIGNLILLLVAIPLTLFFIKKQQELRSSATAASKLYFDPASPNTSSQCSSFNVDIMLDPSTNLVSIVDFYFTYDPTKVDVSQITPSENFTTVVRASTITSGAANMSVSIGADVTKSISTISKVATVTFTPKAAGNFQISFDTTKTRVFSIGPSDEPYENVLSSTSPANVTIGSGACLDGGATPGGATATPAPTTTLPTATPATNPTTTPGAGGGANTIPACTSLTVGPSATGSAPFAVLFSGSGTDPDATGLITKASFTLGDGQVQDVTTGLNQKSANVQANHTYQTPGNYAARLTFTDNAGGVSNACVRGINVTASASASASPTLAPTATTAPTATPTLVQKPTVSPTAVPTIPPAGSFAQTMGTLSLVVIALIGGFILLAL
jgi:hypothetical protein